MSNKQTSLEQAVAQMKPAVDELEQLNFIVIAFERLNEQQKSRAMKYLTDRYRKYTPSPSYED